MKNISIITIVIFLILASCEKKLNIDLPDSEKKIVVNGIVNPDSLMTVRISKSMNVLDNNKIQYLSDASAKIYKNDVFLEELNSLDSGYFQTSIMPEINTEYKLTVDYSDLKSAYASIKLVEAVNILSVDTVSEMQINTYDGKYVDTSYVMHFEIKISDNATNINYYFLSLRAMIPVYDYDINTGEMFIIGYEEGNMDFDSDDPVLRNTDWFTLDKMQGIVFKDEMFNGNEYTFDIEHYIYKYDNFEEKDLGTMYYIKLLTVTEDVYNYITSYNLNQYTQYDPFAQPVQIMTNVENGLGLFSGYTMDIDSVLIQY